MRVLVLIIWFMFAIISVCSSEPRYLYIDKVGKVDVGQEAGQTPKGAIIACPKISDIGEPTRAEYSRYEIRKIDITQEECNSLIEVLYDEDSTDDVKPIVKSRKNKVDYEKFNSKKQKGDITKKELEDNRSRTDGKPKRITNTPR